MRPYLFLFLFSLLIPFTVDPSLCSGQQQERVFAEYLQYLMQEEGYNLTDAIKELQSLRQGEGIAHAVIHQNRTRPTKP